MGNRLDKQMIIDEIQSYITPKNKAKLQHIINLLIKSIDVKYWQPYSSSPPGNYTFSYKLSLNSGYPYFSLDRRAVLALRKLRCPVSFRPNIMAWVIAIANLDQEESSYAIADAISGGGNATDITNAQNAYNQGLTFLSDQVYDQAIRHFGIAFKLAQDSLLKPTGVCLSNLTLVDWTSTLTTNNLIYTGGNTLYVSNLLVGARIKSHMVLLANPNQILTLSASDYALVPFITTQPVATLSAAGPISVVTSSTSSAISYQWYNGNVAISGATSTTLNVTTSGTYVCVITVTVNGIAISAVSSSTVF
jgi:hypothetical protein